MNKKERQHKIIKTIAISPWAYTAEKLSEILDANIKSIYRDLSELKEHYYEILKDEKNQLYLQNSGWDSITAIKDATIRQVDILRFIASYKNGVNRQKSSAGLSSIKKLVRKR